MRGRFSVRGTCNDVEPLKGLQSHSTGVGKSGSMFPRHNRGLVEKALITGKRGERGRGEKRKGMKGRNLTGEIFLRIGPETTNFDISFNRNKTTYAAIRHVPWVLNTPKMHGANVVPPSWRS